MQLIFYVYNFLFGSKTTEDNTRDPHSTIFRAWSGNLPQATSVLRVFFSIMGSAESRSVNNFSKQVVPQGLLGRQDRILRGKVVPQGAFGQTKSADPRLGVSEHFDLGEVYLPMR